VRDELATHLQEAMEDMLGDELDFGKVFIGVVDGSHSSLWLPIALRGLRRVDLKAVAQAILIRAGKCAPDKERPEAR
jgi:hypothetical protein